MLATSEPWTDRAACRGEDPETFFPISEDGPGRAQVARAKGICRGCPVSVQCLDEALARGERAGIWGGMTTEERRQLRRAAP